MLAEDGSLLGGGIVIVIFLLVIMWGCMLRPQSVLWPHVSLTCLCFAHDPCYCPPLFIDIYNQ